MADNRDFEVLAEFVAIGVEDCFFVFKARSFDRGSGSVHQLVAEVDVDGFLGEEVVKLDGHHYVAGAAFQVNGHVVVVASQCIELSDLEFGRLSVGLGDGNRESHCSGAQVGGASLVFGDCDVVTAGAMELGAPVGHIIFKCVAVVDADHGVGQRCSQIDSRSFVFFNDNFRRTIVGRFLEAFVFHRTIESFNIVNSDTELGFRVEVVH